MLRITLYVITCMLTFNASAHKFYTSLSDVSYNPQSQSLELIHTLATHDVENTLSKLTDDKLPKVTSAEFEKLLRRYIELRFNVFQGNNKLAPQWVGYEAGIHNITIYQEITDFALPSSLLINNRLLMDFFPQQVNTVNLSVGQQQTTLTYTEQSVPQVVELSEVISQSKNN